MKLINVFFFALILMTFGACNNSGNNAASAEEKAAQLAAEQALWGETMTIHDKAMNLMGGINNLKTMLSEQIEKSQDEAAVTVAKMAIDNLDKADEGMMEWMSNLQKLEDLRKEKSHEEIMTYLQEQKEAATQIAEDITTSQVNGKKALKPFFE